MKSSFGLVRGRCAVRKVVAAFVGSVVLSALLASAAAGQLPTTDDPRVGLSAGFEDAGVANNGVDLSAHLNKPEGFFDPANLGAIAFANSDLAFQGDRLTGQGAEALLDLVDKKIITLYDVLVVGRADDGSVYALDLADGMDEIGGFGQLAGARSGLLTDEEMHEAAATMEPGSLAVLIVYENTWAVPFISAAMDSGGEVIASARIPAQDVMDALDALEAREAQEAGGAPAPRQPVAATPSGG